MGNKDSLMLRPDARRALIFLILSIGGFLSGINGIISSHPWIGDWTLIAICPFAFFHLADKLLPNSSCFLVSPEGFRIKSFYRFKLLIKWSDIKGFETANWHGLFFHFKHVRCVFLESNKRTKLTLRDNYGMKAEELADLLNKKRAEYLGLKQ